MPSSVCRDHFQAAFVDHFDFFDEGRIGDTKKRCHLRAHLRRVAIDGLLAAEDQINVTQFANSAGERSGGCPGIGAGEGSITQQNGVVHAARERLPQRFISLRRSHGQDGYPSTKRILDFQCRFDSKKIEGIDDGLHTLPDQRVRVRVNADVLGVGHLLDTDGNVHGSSLFSAIP